MTTSIGDTAMKVMAKNCTECRKKIHQEEQNEYLKHEYAWLKDGMFTMACMSAAVALSALMRRGRSKEYVRKFFDDMVLLYDTSSVLGKQLILPEVMKELEEEYGIDFNRIHVNFSETEKEFIKNCKENKRR